MRPNERRRRADEIAIRIAEPREGHLKCAVYGCDQPTRSAARAGLNQVYCRRHEDHYQRHGSYFKQSYTGPELRAYRIGAEQWLNVNTDDEYARVASKAIDALFRSSRSESAFNLPGLPPAERARVAWGRLKRAEVPVTRVLAAWLGVEMRIADDPQPDQRVEFKRVQAAKVVHRLASGTHRRWERERYDGRMVVNEVHKYPASRGRVLRHIGEALELATELVVAHRILDIRECVSLPPGFHPSRV